ncbi:methylated-DNA--protein-cysteine methyltransferase [Liquorilactobacillus aquaticus DSM 21051]|uniref:methylated-DNA--[protein]-cysteine S-methyltransferase n=1 Tax=Liquorilactobacillus aquaticus DSM 21051 TaxID=1423725 RepID=A0A0R2CXE2_9LACO|nr:methylated-DNA--[protein]-cysteine S-methyltransferase [Liquorilactobacillus aquaticus]KRM96272.1 methylated-DNA--protein-cysteine methyltransferase [Liquorilactobacillus aquaticus DSM 21051]
MIESEQQKEIYYDALVKKNTEFDGIFFAGIKTTGVFCHPLSFPQELPPEVKVLVDAVEQNPEKEWKDYDFKLLGIHSASARRKFKKVYGMTFVQYARSRRIGIAFKEIQNGSKVIDQQIASGFESASGFNDAFTRIMGSPSKIKNMKVLNTNFIETPIGRMISISDDNYLYLLEFENRRGLETEISNFRKRHSARLIYGSTKIYELTSKEIHLYFEKKLDKFTVPVFLDGSQFQKNVWNILLESQSGDVLTYKKIAALLGNVKKSQAVGNANGANKIAIIIPCHRVINSNGEIGGYGGGKERKKYLLNLESS